MKISTSLYLGLGVLLSVSPISATTIFDDFNDGEDTSPPWTLIDVSDMLSGPLVNRLYFWDLIGAGLGCALVVWLIDWFQTPAILILVASLFAVAGAVACGGASKRLRLANLVAAAAQIGDVLESCDLQHGFLAGSESRGRGSRR